MSQMYALYLYRTSKGEKIFLEFYFFFAKKGEL
jgi:hypothetical protein